VLALFDIRCVRRTGADFASSACQVCHKPGMLLLCDEKTCGSGYHLACLKPPLKYVPKGDWFCGKHKPRPGSK
jgi:hypothetical protein